MTLRPLNRYVVYLAAFLACLTGLHYLGWLRPIEALVSQSIAPASQLVYTWEQTINRYDLPFSNPDEFVSAYYDLRQESNIHDSINARITVLEQENEELRSQLDFRTREHIKTIGADVIGKTVDTLASTILINRGEEDGLNVGDPVVVQNGILAGLIARVDKQTAVVRLIKDRQSKVAGAVVNNDKTIGLVEGGYGLSVRMNFIPQHEQLENDQTVITSGLEAQIPRGLIIGTIEAYEREAYQPFQQAVITPAVDLDRLTLVSIITTSE